MDTKKSIYIADGEASIREAIKTFLRRHYKAVQTRLTSNTVTVSFFFGIQHPRFHAELNLYYRKRR